MQQEDNTECPAKRRRTESSASNERDENTPQPSTSVVDDVVESNKEPAKRHKKKKRPAVMLQTVQVSPLQKIVSALKDLLDDCVMVFTPEGLRVTAMDPSHTALCCLQLFGSQFDTFHCEQEVSVGVNLEWLNNIMSAVNPSKSQDITWVIQNATDDVLTISTGTVDTGGGDESDSDSDAETSGAEWKMRLCNFDAEPIRPMEMDPDVTFTVPHKEFLEHLRVLHSNAASTPVTIGTDVAKKTVTLTNSGMGGACKIVLRHVEGGGGGITATNTSSHKRHRANGGIKMVKFLEDTTDAYASKFLNVFCKASSLCERITVKLKKGHPMCLEYQLASLGFVSYVLAPRVGDE